MLGGDISCDNCGNTSANIIAWWRYIVIIVIVLRVLILLLGGDRSHLWHWRVADMAGTPHSGVSSSHNVVVSCGTQDNVPHRDLDEEVSVLPALWCRVSRLVRLLANSRLRLCLAVCSQQIQDYYLWVYLGHCQCCFSSGCLLSTDTRPSLVSSSGSLCLYRS